MSVRVVSLNPYHPVLGILISPMVQRIMDYARQHTPECDPLEVAKRFIVPIYMQEPTVLILGLVNDEATLVGHMVASLQNDGSKTWAQVSQYRADGNVGEAGLEALDVIKRWAQGAGASTLVLVTTSPDGDGRWKERGFEATRYVRHMALGQPKQPVVA